MLIDTHALIWFLEGDDRLSQKAISAIEGNLDPTYVSMASLWEIGIKSSLGKLVLHYSFKEILDAIKENTFRILPVSEADIATIINLPFHHRDPFDRLIIAQSQNNNFPIVSKDEIFNLYGVKMIW